MRCSMDWSWSDENFGGLWFNPQIGNGNLGRVVHQQVYMVILAVELHQLRFKVPADAG